MNHDQRLAEIATLNTVLRTLNGRDDAQAADMRDRVYRRIDALLSTDLQTSSMPAGGVPLKTCPLDGFTYWSDDCPECRRRRRS